MHTSSQLHSRPFAPSDNLGHTPSKSMLHRAVADPAVTKHISSVLAACEFLQYDVLETHGVSLRLGPAAQLIVLQVSDNSIAATHGFCPLSNNFNAYVLHVIYG